MGSTNMGGKIRIDTRRDRIVLGIHLISTYLIAVATNCYAFLPFRHFDKNDDSQTKEWTDSPAFTNIFYLGLGLGSVVGGASAYLTSPEQMANIFCKTTVLFSMLGAFLINDILSNESFAMYQFVWFFLGFTAFATYLCTYIHTLESVPGRWKIYVGMGLFGMSWTTGRLYSIMLALLVSDPKDRLFWNTFVMFCVITLQDIVVPRRTEEKGEQEKEKIIDLFRKNSLGSRYLICLLVLWTVNGYIYYGISHYIYLKSSKDQVFVCITDAIAKLLGLFLCRWTKQKRAVMATMLMLSALGFFSMAIIYSSDGSDKSISTMAQVCSFLIGASWNILWLLSIEIFGPGARCITQGLCSCSSRLASLIGALVVRNDLFLAYPAAIAGVVSIAGALIALFLLHEPDLFELTRATRRKKSR